MHILIANDDGYLAPGLAALVRACEGLGTIDIVAPEQDASGTSNALTLRRRTGEAVTLMLPPPRRILQRRTGLSHVSIHEPLLIH